MLRIFMRNKYTILLCFVLVNVIAAPFFSQSDHPELFFNMTFSLVLLTAVLSVAKDKKLSQTTSIVLVLPCLFFVWQAYFYTIGENVLIVSALVQTLFIAYISLLIILFIFRSPAVTRDVVSAALVVYLFSAVLFAKLYLILELACPGSFSVSHDAIRNNPGILKYFSLVTLSTLGYGDLLPVNDKSQTLASMEAIFGQIYLAVLIARLVGMQGAPAPFVKKSD